MQSLTPRSEEFGINDFGGRTCRSRMKQLDPGASPQEWFGNELRRLRLAQGLSAKELGRLVQVSDDMILSIEKGKYPSCRRDVTQRLDDVLRTGGLLDRAWPMVFGNRDADKRQTDADKASPRRGEGPTHRAAAAPRPRACCSSRHRPRRARAQPVLDDARHAARVLARCDDAHGLGGDRGFAIVRDHLATLGLADNLRRHREDVAILERQAGRARRDLTSAISADDSIASPITVARSSPATTSPIPSTPHTRSSAITAPTSAARLARTRRATRAGCDPRCAGRCDRSPGRGTAGCAPGARRGRS